MGFRNLSRVLPLQRRLFRLAALLERDLRFFHDPAFLPQLRAVDLILPPVALNLLALSFPIVSLQIYDRILNGHNIATLTALFTGLAIAFCLECFLRVAQAYVQEANFAAFEHAASIQLLRKISDSGVTLKHRDAAILRQSLENAKELKSLYCGQLFHSLLELPFMMLFLFTVVYIGAWLALVPIALLAYFAYFTGKKIQILDRITRKREQVSFVRQNYVFEALSGIHTVKAQGAENQVITRYVDLTKRFEIYNYKENSHYLAVQNLQYFLAQLMLVLVGVVGATMVLRGSLTLGALIASILLCGRLVGPLYRVFEEVAKIQSIRLMRREFLRLLKQKENVITEAGPWLRENAGFLCVRAVSYQSTAEQPIFTNLNLNIYCGTCVSLSAESEILENLFVKLISGELKPSSGTILINGKQAHQLPDSQLSANVGFLTEHGVIYSGTIAENITNFGAVPFETALEISKILGLHEAVLRLAEGYDSRLEGNLADPISPGLKQNISIVRALARKPRIIVWHHAERHMDRSNYARALKLLGAIRERAAILVISRDKNILSLANRHLSIKDRTLQDDLGHRVLFCQDRFRRKELESMWRAA